MTTRNARFTRNFAAAFAVFIALSALTMAVASVLLSSYRI
jgi:hypothetical protein